MKKRLQRQKRRKRRTIPVPIASMGDIAFLLIIFFLVCSEVAKTRTDLEVTSPFSMNVQKIQASVAARVTIDKEGEIYFDGARVDGPKDVEWGVRAVLTNTISDDQRHIQLTCDAALPKEIYEPVVKAIVSAGGILEAVGEKPQ